MGVVSPGAGSPVAGQVAAITGAAGVIGAAIARAFVDAGIRVVLGDVRVADLDRLAVELGGRSVAVACPADVSRPDDVRRLVGMAPEVYGRLDALVNVAGITHVDDILEISLDTWRHVMAVNLEGPLVAAQQAARLMSAQDVDPDTQRRGIIVNISSQGAELPIPTSTAYGVSKVALNYLSRTLATALERRSIATTIVYPGMVYDGMWKWVNRRRSQLWGYDLDEVVRRDLAETPTGSFQDPDDLARMVLYAVATPGMLTNGRVLWSEAHLEW
ncbi:MAG: SDR family NAD(P)-dependent oxidoreductase [bacterium]|nr:SDR family NAD(P)-dependent oxidoreductase [bacterium]